MPDICHMNLASSVVALAPTSLLWFSGRASGLAARRSLPTFIPSGGLALPDFPDFNKSSFKVADSQSKKLERKQVLFEEILITHYLLLIT